MNSIALRKATSRLASSAAQREVVERRLDRHVAIQRDELLRDADQLDDLGIGQRLAALGLLDLAGAREQRFEIAIFGDELRRGLDADARRARHVVGRIAGERLDVDDLVRRRRRNRRRPRRGRCAAPRASLRRSPEAGSYIATPGLDELHQVLVGRDDQHVGAALARLARIGRDEVVGLVAVLLDRDQAEGAHGRRASAGIAARGPRADRADAPCRAG